MGAGAGSPEHCFRLYNICRNAFPGAIQLQFGASTICRTGEMRKKNRQLIDSYGNQWARNMKNIGTLRELGKLCGVYVLCDGSMPVYIGRGRLASRIASHIRSKSRGQFWDHFSWYAIPDRRFETDVEALLLRMLPFYLRSLNKQRTRFVDGHRIEQVCRAADPIRRPKFLTRRRRRSWAIA